MIQYFLEAYIRKQGNMIKDTNKKTGTKKSIIIWNISIFLCIAAIILATVYWDYYSIWTYIDFSFLKASSEVPTQTVMQTTETPTATASFSPSPSPTSQKPVSPTITPLPTPIPTPTPIPHPGDRDGKFTQGDIVIKDNEYHSKDLSIEINKYYENDITYFVAEVYVRDMDNFLAVFAGGKYGSKREITTKMAQENSAIFAVSGDYYNAREGGIIIRNSVVYRNEKEPYREVLAIYNDGSMKGYRYKEAYDGRLNDDSIVHTYVFGPILILNGELGREFSDKEHIVRHPRLSIGMAEPYHYYFILADGRKKGYSIGMTVVELTDIFLELDCTEAYNLDGGGTATMVFMDELVNLPQGTTKQRGIGDSICFVETDGGKEE